MPKKEEEKVKNVSAREYYNAEDKNYGLTEDDMMKFAQMRAADKKKTMKNSDPRITNRSRILLSSPDLYKKSKLKMKKDDEY